MKGWEKTEGLAEWKVEIPETDACLGEWKEEEAEIKICKDLYGKHEQDKKFERSDQDDGEKKEMGTMAVEVR